MIINILKAITYFFGFVIFFAFLHVAQHNIMGKHFSGHMYGADAKKEFRQHKGKRPQHKRGGSPLRDKNGDLVRHGFLQHHLHAQDGRIVWQKETDTIEASITKDTE